VTVTVLRRALVVGIAALLVGQPDAAAQQAAKVRRVGWIVTTSPVAELEGATPAHPSAYQLVQRLRELGYVEGRNLVLERRSAEGRFERFPDLIKDLVRLKTDVILTTEVAMTREAQRITPTIPIVFVTSDDPVQAGLVTSLARPDRNVTGFTTIGQEIVGKRVEILTEAFPATLRIAYLGLRSNWEGLEGRSLRAAASTIGVSIFLAEHQGSDYSQAFARIQKEADAVLPANNAPNVGHRKHIVDRLAQMRLPALYPYRMFVDAGGLMSYGPDLPTLYRGVAEYTARILEGTSPGELPIQQPTRFDLVISLKAARALGFTIPPSLLRRADRVIE